MLLEYHLTFLILSIILLILGIYILFIMEEKKWSILVSMIILGLNTVICWITVLGFFGIQYIGLDNTNTFQVYTHPSMYGLNVLPFGILFISIIVAWVGWGKHMRKIADEVGNGTIKSPLKTNRYWDKNY